MTKYLKPMVTWDTTIVGNVHMNMIIGQSPRSTSDYRWFMLVTPALKIVLRYCSSCRYDQTNMCPYSVFVFLRPGICKIHNL